jgi:hypothetical protein
MFGDLRMEQEALEEESLKSPVKKLTLSDQSSFSPEKIEAMSSQEDPLLALERNLEGIKDDDKKTEGEEGSCLLEKAVFPEQSVGHDSDSLIC